jgi:hypothetical protein
MLTKNTSSRAITQPKIIWPERNSNINCNSSRYSYIPNIKSISQRTSKKSQNCVRQLRSPAKMAATVQLHCYWKQLWSRWAITGSCEPLVLNITMLWINTTQNAKSRIIVVLFHCCTLIWGLTNNNYNLYFKLLQFMTQCQYTFVLYLHSLAIWTYYIWELRLYVTGLRKKLIKSLFG